MSDDKTLWTGVEQLSKHIKIVDAENGGRVVVISGEEQKASDYKEIIVKEYHDEKGLITRREIGEELVRCKDCKYRPVKHDLNGGEGFNLKPPTEESWSCPCLNEDDGWYSWMPDDDFYCSYGERKDDDE